MFDEVVKLSSAFIKSNKNWRDHSKLYSELSKIVDLIPYTLISDFYESMMPKLLKLMRTGADLIKKDASLLISTLIYNLPNKAKQK